MKVDVFKIFLILVFVRYFTEQVDATSGLLLSPMFTVLYLILGGLLLKEIDFSFINKFCFFIAFFLLLIVFQGVISAASSNNILLSQSLKQLLKYSSYLAVFYIALKSFTSLERIKKIVKYSLVAAGISSVLAIIQLPLGIGHADIGTPRPFGFSSHPAMLALLLFVTGTNYLMVKWQSNLSISPMKTELILFILIFIALMITQARTTWAALSITVFLVLLSRKKIKELSVVGIISLAILPFVSKRFSDISSIFSFVNERKYMMPNYYDVVESSFHWRIVHWYRLIQQASENHVMGFGPGMTTYINDFNKSAHSSFVELYVEQGIIGFNLYVLLLISMIIFIKHYTKSFKKNVRWLIYGQYLGVLFASTFGQGVFNETQIMQTLMIGLAIIFFLSKQAEKYVITGSKTNYEKIIVNKSKI